MSLKTITEAVATHVLHNASAMGQEAMQRNLKHRPFRRLAPGPQQITMNAVPFNEGDEARIARAKERRAAKAARRVAQNRGK